MWGTFLTLNHLDLPIACWPIIEECSNEELARKDARLFTIKVTLKRGRVSLCLGSHRFDGRLK
jgi:hypothetical protein